MLKKWNDAFTVLHPALSHPDTPSPLTLYGETWQPGDKISIPDVDFPPGLVLSHGLPAGADRAGFGSL